MKEAVDVWTVQDALEQYDVEKWGKGYFSISPTGNLLVHPGRDPKSCIDLKQLIDRLQIRGLDLPILLRFNGILKDRLKEIHTAFSSAIREHDFKGRYTCVYPVKVNQQRRVVEKIIEYGREFGFGLEAGSKPELLAVVAMMDAVLPIICNGFKDAEFIEMAMLAQKIGRNVIPVVEKYTELGMILHYAAKVGV
ncbi:MAG: arginine decarboxylase, partial [Pirellulaceae bacterium]